MHNPHLTDSSLRLSLDALSNSFEATRSSGGTPKLEEVVQSVPETFQPEMFRKLLLVELEHHAKTDQPFALDEILNRFRSLGAWAEPIIRELLSETANWNSPRTPHTATRVSNPEFVGQYELLAKLGSGAYGTVFKARHTQLKRFVALKVLTPHQVITPGGTERFFREMEILGRLNHPHIVRATDAGEARGYHYLAMELIEGLDVGYVLKKVTRLPIPEACEIVRQAAEALIFIDQHRMVHRDMKPSNMLLGLDGVLRVLDLGLAQLSDIPPWEQLTLTGAVMGTPEYMSPEQTRESRDVNIRSDVYSLGCTLFALLTGAPPFTRSGSMYDLFRAHNETPPPSIETIRNEAPQELQRLILQMLEKQPSQRPAPEEIVQMLRPFCVGANLEQLVADCGPRNELPVFLPPAHSPLPSSSDRNENRAEIPTTALFTYSPSRSRRTRRWVFAVAALAVVLGGGTWAIWNSKRDQASGQAPAPSSPPETPTANPAILSVPEFPPRTFKPGEWTDLIDRPPTKKIWPENDRSSQFVYEKEHRQLSVGCIGYCALELGSVEAEAYDVKAVIFQYAWSLGRVGVFVCGRHPSGSSPAFSWRSDSVFLQTIETGNADMLATLARGEIGVFADTGGHRLLDQVLYNIPRPRTNDHTLSFTVSRSGITNIVWDKEAAVRVTRPSPERMLRTDGSIGVLVHDSSALFRSVQIRPHHPPGAPK